MIAANYGAQFLYAAFHCSAWAFSSSDALADSSALAAACWVTLSISATAVFT